MKPIFALLCLCVLAAAVNAQPQEKKLKVFISVDMEGVSGVVTSDQTGAGGADYNRSGTTTVQDLFDFLAGYFAGCA